MSRKHKHHDRDDDVSIHSRAYHYLRRDGLSFDFDAGRERYDYQIAIGDHNRDKLAGGKERDYFWGLRGDDTLNGGRENDGLYGDGGDDVLVGGEGGDRLTGGSGNDRLYGGTQADGLRGGDGNDYLDEGAGHGDLDGGAGNDILIGGQGPDAFGVDRMSGDDIIRDFTPGPGMFDHLALRDLRWEDLTFQDTAAGVKVSWTGGSVVLENVMKSQLAHDDFMFADAPDLPPGPHHVSGPTPESPSMSSDGPRISSQHLPGSGFDKAADDAIKDGKLDFGFRGDEAFRVAVGTARSDTMHGTAAWDHLFGRDGNDSLFGLGGDDVLQGDAGNDYLDGGIDNDRIDGGMGNDRLFGGMGMDEMMGADGNDYIDAGAGHDMIEGGMGSDTIRGGTGADAFIVDPLSGFDVVLDFEARGDAQGAFDHLALRDILPEQVSVRDTSRGAVVSWNTDSDRAAEGSVLVQDVFKADLRQSDFMFVGAPGFVAGIDDFGSHLIFAA